MENTSPIRHDWTHQELLDIHNGPLLELIFQAAKTHRMWHKPNEVQIATLLSIKTGGCPEDCAYCPQAARYQTETKVHALLPTETVVAIAKDAKKNGATRFCMAAAWREVRNNRDFDRVLEMVKEVKNLGLEVCCTLGMLTPDQAERLKQAGLDAYNHNIDTSEKYYEKIISTRKFENRIDTLNAVREAGISVCTGGIIGLGESVEDRISMLQTLSNLSTHPESIPINALVRIPGTPLENNPKINLWEMVRMIAVTRITIPKAMIRLSAGRVEMNETKQAWCFMAGANSIFSGEQKKLLVTPNPELSEDLIMFQNLGLKPMSTY